MLAPTPATSATTVTTASDSGIRGQIVAIVPNTATAPVSVRPATTTPATTLAVTAAGVSDDLAADCIIMAQAWPALRPGAHPACSEQTISTSVPVGKASSRAGYGPRAG